MQSSGSNPKNMLKYLKGTQILVHQYLQQRFSQTSKGRNNPDVCQQMNGRTKCGVCIQQDIIQPKKG